MSIATHTSKGIRHRIFLPTFGIAVLTAVTGLISDRSTTVEAQSTARPVMLEPNLAIRTEASGLITPISIAFLGLNDGMLVLEKQTGQVKRIVNRAVHSIVLDLGVNNASERGLLGIATHPNFPANPGVYLFWTCRATVGQDGDPFRPEQQACADA